MHLQSWHIRNTLSTHVFGDKHESMILSGSKRYIGMNLFNPGKHNIVYHFFRQLWPVLGVELMEINSNLFSRSFEYMHMSLFFDYHSKFKLLSMLLAPDLYFCSLRYFEALNSEDPSTFCEGQKTWWFLIQWQVSKKDVSEQIQFFELRTIKNTSNIPTGPLVFGTFLTHLFEMFVFSLWFPNAKMKQKELLARP